MRLNSLSSTIRYGLIMRWEKMKIVRVAVVALIALTGFAGVPAQAGANDAGWRSKVAQLIKANYTYPRSAQLRGEQGSAKIKIAISSSGKILSVDLLQSTGSAILDREAVRIPMKVGSFPAPPTGSNVELVYPITWRMDEEQ
jgi:protein TonB